MKFIRQYFLFIILMVPFFAYGNALEVSPIHIYLQNKKPIETLYLTNKSQQAMYLQLDAWHWQQKLGKDYYQKTNQLIIFPPIVTIDPGKTQLIRIGLQNNNNSNNEKSYRLYIQEIPPFQEKNTGISFNLRIGIPVFIEQNSPSKKTITWHANIKNQNLILHLSNTSHYHFQLLQINILDNHHQTLVSEKTFLYLLPGQTKTFVFPLKTHLDKLDKYVNVEAKSDWGLLHYRIQI